MLLNQPRALTIMQEEGLEGLLATSPENIFYLSEFVSPGHLAGATALVLATREALSQPQFIITMGDTRGLLADFAVDPAHIWPFGTYFVATGNGKVALSETEQAIDDLFRRGETAKTPEEALVRALQHKGLSKSTVGVDESGVPWAFFERVQQQLPDICFQPSRSIFRQIRSVKTKEELRRMRKGVRITETAILEAMRIARVGITERAMARTLELSLVNQGARPLFTTLGFGARTAYTPWPGEATLRDGDVMRFDVGCVYEGYKTDIGRTVVFGKASDRVKECHAAVLAGADAVIGKVKPGVEVRELFRVGVEAVRQAGIEWFDRHHVGHSIGLEIYEYPVLLPQETAKLEPGMVLSIETPYKELGLGGFIVEDAIVITEDGAEILTSIPRDLIVLD